MPNHNLATKRLLPLKKYPSQQQEQALPMSDHSALLLPEQKVFGAAVAQRRDLHEANEPLLPETQFSGFVPTAADRNITDKPFAFALAAAAIFWLISGLCSVGTADMTWLTQLHDASQSQATVQFSVSKIMSVFLGLVVFSCSVACCCGFGWIRLVQRYPLKVVSFSFFANMALWLAVLIIGISIGSLYLALFGVVMGALYVFLYMVSAKSIERTATLMQYASHVINSQPGLIRLMFMGAVGVTIVSALSSWFSVASYSSGSVVDCKDEADCDDQDGWFGSHGPSKAFRPSSWSFFVLIFNVLMFYTLVSFLLLAQLFVAAYVTSVYYFHGTEENRCLSAIDNGIEAAQLQSGTIAVAAFVRATVETLVYFCERALQLSRRSQDSEQSCVQVASECLVRAFLRLLQYFADVAARYCTMSAAVTGQAFMPSYRYTRLALSQNGWKMLTVDSLTNSTCSLCALVVGFLVGSIAYAFTSAALHWSDVDHGHVWAVSAALFSGFISFAIFQLFSSLIVNVVDSLYLCFALDSDENRGRFCSSHDIPMTVFDNCKSVDQQSDHA